MQRNLPRLHVVAHENGRGGAELPRVFGGEVFALPVFAALRIHFGMSHKIVGKTFCHKLTLRHKLYVCGGVLSYLVNHKRVMGATKYYRIYFGVLSEQFVNVFPNKIIGSGRCIFSILDYGNPHGALLTRYLYVGIELGDFHVV